MVFQSEISKKKPAYQKGPSIIISKARKKSLPKQWICSFLRSFHYSDDETNTPLKNALNEAIEHRKGHIDKLREMTDFKVDDFYFFKLAFQVEEFYPDFKSKVENTFSEEENEWREVLQMAVQKGEIHKNTDIDLTLSLLMLIPRGLGLSMAFSSGISTDSLKEIYEKFYRTLKE